MGGLTGLANVLQAGWQINKKSFSGWGKN